MPYPATVLAEVALSEAEYQEIVARLGREPNRLELGIFGALWSEHCGYKHSKPLLRRLPRRSPRTRVLVEAGEENAGAVDIGEGWAVVFKVESHNHPSAVEPYQGAATGVGGIVRDIFTMGARPIALLNSLRFGPLDDPRNRYLFRGVVGGIAGYGNCLGIPDVGGEIQVAPPYAGNPLVNAMCVGLLRHEELVRARASGEGNLLLLVGADTGRDGIHGATFASVELSAAEERRPAVQVGNPFLEKLLLEACLEVVRLPAVVAMQDLGAAGLTSATVEAAAKGGAGVEIDVLRVPRREEGMTPYEVMLSESQERMLVVVRAGQEAAVQAVFARWGLHAAVIGQVTASGRLVVREGETVVADLPIAPLVDPPQYRYDHFLAPPPPYLEQVQRFDPTTLPPSDPARDLLDLLSSPNIASRRPVFRQYDHQVQNNTVVPPGRGDAAVLRIKGSRRAIALSIDGNGRFCFLDPFAGGAMAVAEAARNVVCAGAEPLALTNCLNFGNPERHAVYYQLAQVIAGMAAACEALGVPVISGNVSLYNESERGAIYPTPIVGMLGLLEEVEQRLEAGFLAAGDVVLLIGEFTADPATLAGSEWLATRHGLVAGRPRIDLGREVAVQQTVLAAARARLLHSAHDCSEGGLAVALAESCILGGQGFRARFALPPRPEGLLFGEAPSRIVVSCPTDHLAAVSALAEQYGAPITLLGEVGGTRFQLAPVLDLPLAELADRWEHGLRRALGQLPLPNEASGR
jgi:phosphoribosylformylglycinamidine synthase II